jgi:hypothetical protein
VPGLKYPFVGSEVLNGFNHSLSDGQLGLPTQGLNLTDIEMDKRVVANPTAIATGVLQLGFNP